MNRLRLISLLVGLLAIISCQENAHEHIKNKTLKLSVYNLKAASGQEVSFLILDDDIDSVYFPTVKPSASAGNKYTFSIKKMGFHAIDVVGFDQQKNQRLGKVQVEIYADVEPEKLSYKISEVYPHNAENYTQGLEFKNGILFESTGQRGQSKVVKYQFPSLKIIKQHHLENNLFGEGLTILDDTVLQLTWIAKKCLLYDKELNVLGDVSLPTQEGWGLAHDKNQLLFSDGSHFIYKTDKNFAVQEQLPIYMGAAPMSKINELEFVNNALWANIYYSDRIVKIDPVSGAVLAYVDLSALRKQLKNDSSEVLNGIAYLEEKDAFLITGKYWDKMFLIEINTETDE